MNTGNTTLTLRHDRFILEKAIALLDVLSQPAAHAVLEYLQEHREASLIDLLVHCQEDRDLEETLQRMVSTGILQTVEHLYQPIYRINRKKLNRIWVATQSMVREKALTCLVR